MILIFCLISDQIYFWKITKVCITEFIFSPCEYAVAYWWLAMTTNHWHLVPLSAGKDTRYSHIFLKIFSCFKKLHIFHQLWSIDNRIFIRITKNIEALKCSQKDDSFLRNIEKIRKTYAEKQVFFALSKLWCVEPVSLHRSVINFFNHVIFCIGGVSHQSNGDIEGFLIFLLLCFCVQPFARETFFLFSYQGIIVSSTLTSLSIVFYANVRKTAHTFLDLLLRSLDSLV